MEKTSRFKKMSRFSQNALTHNLGLKLISVLLAFFLWYGVTGGPKSERTVATTLDITNYIPDGYALADTYTKEFQVRLSGRDNALQRLSDSEVSFSLSRNLIEPKTGTQPIRIKQDDVVTRSGLNVDSVTPNQIIIHLDERYSVRRTVEVTLYGTLPEGYQLFENPPEVNPRFIEITGARRLVDQQEILVAPLNLEDVNITEPNIYTRRVTIEPSPLLQYETREVEVILDVVEVFSERSFRLDGESITFIGLNENSERVASNYQPNSLRILVEGPQSWVDALEEEDIYAAIDLTAVPREERAEVTLTGDMIYFQNPHERQDDLVTVEILNEDKTMSLRIDLR